MQNYVEELLNEQDSLEQIHEHIHVLQDQHLN